MKSLKVLLVLLTMSMSFAVNAAPLKQEVKQGMNKVCIYSDGSAITVSALAFCPLSN